MADDKPGPWTIKLVEQADRDAINAAARRAQQPVGPWLVEAAYQRITRERVQRVPGPAPEPGAGAAPPSAPSPPASAAMPAVADLVLVLRELHSVPRCGQVLARARRLLAAQLAPALPAQRNPGDLRGAGQVLLSTPPAADT